MENQAQAAVLCAVASVAFLYVIGSSWNLGRRLPNMPPGPPTKPIIGNMLDMTNLRLHLRFHEWAKQYGDVFSVKVLGQTMIIISSPNLLREVLDRHANASANRPNSIIAGMIVADGLNMGLSLHTNDVWKAMRRASNQLLGNETMRKMAPYQRAEAAQLLWEFANQSDAWFYHIRRFTTSLVLAVVYGIRGPTLQNPNVKGFMEVHPQFLDCLDIIGAMPPVDLFPFLMYIPERFAQWKEYPKKVRRLQEQLYDRVLSTLETKMASGHGIGSLMEELITQGPSTGIPTREHLMHLGGTLMEGSDTASSSLQVIVLALTRYPEVQKKAQEEMDRIVGPDRTPDERDIQDLKYMQAIIEECYRFRPVGTLGVPRAMAEDAVINGLFYPKGATLFVNFYAMFHDERYYDRPDEFIPERFLKHPYGIKDGVEDDPARRPNLVFGGGKRVCPGIAFAKSSIELNAANFIWAFDFLPAIDTATGKEVYPDLNDYTEGITASPKPFPLRVRPRSAHRKDLIDRQFQSVSDILSRYEYDLSPVDQEFNAKYRDV